MRRWLNIIAALLMSGICAAGLILTWEANDFVVIRGLNQFPISQRLLLGVGVILFLFSGIATFRRARN